MRKRLVFSSLGLTSVRSGIGNEDYESSGTRALLFWRSTRLMPRDVSAKRGTCKQQLSHDIARFPPHIMFLILPTREESGDQTNLCLYGIRT